MEVIRPTAVTDAILLSSDVPEGPGTAYNSGTTYALNARVDVQTGTVIDVYQSRKNGNLLLYSQDFTNAAWTGDAGVSRTANTDLAPDATLTADTLSDTSTTTSDYVCQVIAVPNDTATYEDSIYVKKTSSSATFPLFALDLLGGGTTIHKAASFNTNLGVFIGPVGEWGVADAGSYWRVWGKIANNATGNVSLKASIYPAYGLLSAFGDADVTATGSIAVWGAQIEKGTALTDYTATTSAAVLNLNNPPASSPSWWRKIATTYALHNPGTTYVKGERVISTVTHRIYESLQPSNVGHDPTLEASAAWWLDIGPTNRWAMFDQVVGTATVGTGSVTVSLAPGSLDSLAILDTDAELINVVMTVSGVEVYNSTQSTNVGGNSITDWKLYFFEPIGKKKQVLFLDIPPGYSGAQMSITFTGADPAGPVKVGTVNFGNILFIGDTEQGLKVGVTSFSKVGQDEFGVFSIVKRAKARKFSGRCLLLSENVDPINDALIALLDTPCVWIASRFFDATIAYAFFNDFEIDIEAGAVSFCTLTLQGLT